MIRVVRLAMVFEVRRQKTPFLITLAVGGVAIVWLWPKHQGHLAVVLPYLFLLACPLMHLFHHHGHHGRAGPSAAPSAEGGRDESRGDA
ncbi:MAG: DUF2933 domain-containing protein [Rhodopseudomonas palustris]|uniref:DUF2933 domain-containing protein n=1 Tax=Rhodopseudomonas palustris TaxID=1076 RepID=A0A933RXL2_RHOPL|nr:DUF2933 domain-containing protein [Rhodopseudomonas palustris]